MRAVLLLALLALLALTLGAPPAEGLTTAVRKGGRSKRGSTSKNGSSSKGRKRKIAAAAGIGLAGAAAAKKFGKKPKKPKFGGGGFEEEPNPLEEAQQQLEEEAALAAQQRAEESALACFPAAARVVVRGTAKRIGAVRVGDEVATGPRSASRVYMLSHAEPAGLFPFVRLETGAGALVASPGHLLHSARGLLPARDVRVGDALPRADGSVAVVRATRRIVEEGLFNPQTFDGDLVVDGFVVSTYTEAVPVAAAVPLLAPLRALFAATGVDVSAGALEGEGPVRSTLTAAMRSVRKAGSVSMVL